MEAEFKVKDFTDIHALCSKRADSFSIIGDQFCQIFRGRDIVSVCLTLVASYQECESIICVTQRLIIVYLLYRLKEVGKLSVEQRDSDEPEILVHPFLLIFVKIYADFAVSSSSPKVVDSGDEKKSKDSPSSSSITTKENGIIHLLGNFPKVTPQEAHFVGRILTDPPQSLKALFRLSPAQVADNPVSNLMSDIDISMQLEYVESQLEQFRVFGREGVQDNMCDAKGTNSLPVIDPTLLNHYARIVYSLIPPPFVRIEPSVMPPCEDEFRFIYPSLIQPEQVQDDWLKDEEWNQEKMRPLEKTQASAFRVSLRSSAPPSPSGARKQPFSADVPFSGVVSSGGYGAGPNLESALSNSPKSLNKSAPICRTTPPNYSFNNNQNSNSNSGSTMATPSALMPRATAVESLRKICAGTATNSLSKAEANRLLLTVSEDPQIFKEVNINDSFSKLVEYHSDIAAELLLYEFTQEMEVLSLHFEVLLGLEFSVQSLVTVNKFISSCEIKELEIPEEFLNRFITYCMTSCEQSQKDVNQLLTHRLVRMVCVFFNTLIRLKKFDAKPRLMEMKNFSTIFVSLKEASNLYQSIIQAE